MSSTFEDEGPIPWFRTEMAIYYIVYFVVFPFFFVNIFVALVIVTFNELGEAELTDNIDKNQASLVTAAKRIIRLTETQSSEIVYNVRRDNKTARNLRPRNSSGSSVPHMEARHLAALWELHHAAHHPQHHPPHVQGRFSSSSSISNLPFGYRPYTQKAEKNRLMIVKKYISFCWSMEISSYSMNIHDKVKLCDSFCESSSIWRNGNQVILLGYSLHVPHHIMHF